MDKKHTYRFTINYGVHKIKFLTAPLSKGACRHHFPTYISFITCMRVLRTKIQKRVPTWKYVHI